MRNRPLLVLRSLAEVQEQQVCESDQNRSALHESALCVSAWYLLCRATGQGEVQRPK